MLHDQRASIFDQLITDGFTDRRHAALELLPSQAMPARPAVSLVGKPRDHVSEAAPSTRDHAARHSPPTHLIASPRESVLETMVPCLPSIKVTSTVHHKPKCEGTQPIGKCSGTFLVTSQPPTAPVGLKHQKQAKMPCLY